MATVKKYIDLADLTLFKQLNDQAMASAIATAEARSLHTVSISGNTLNFYREEEPVGSATPAYSITLPSFDPSVLAAVATSGAAADVSVADVGALLEATTVEAALAEIVTKADTNATAIAAINNASTGILATAEDYTDTAIAGLDGVISGTGFVSSISQTDGVVTATLSQLTASDIPSLTLDKISDAGDAAGKDVDTIINKSATPASTNVPTTAAVIGFVASEISGMAGSMHFQGVVTRESGQTDAQAIAAYYTAHSLTAEAGDTVVMADNAKEYIYDGTAWREVGDETEFVKKTTTIAGIDLQDNITAQELKAALDVGSGTIAGVKVNGSELTPDAEQKVNVTVAEGSTNGTLAVNGTDVAVHGLGSAAYTASTAYDAAGAAAAVLGTSTDTATDNTVYGAKAYADSLYDDIGAVPTSAIQALFSNGD